MLDTKDLTLGLEVATNRARSAAKALTIVAEDLTRSRLAEGEDKSVITLRLEEDQIEAFEFLVGQVLTLTREASGIAQALARELRGQAEAIPAITAKRRQRGDGVDESFMPTLKRES